MVRIVCEPDPLLHKKTEQVTFPLQKNIKELIKILLDYVIGDETSAGLAAPQVGISQAVAVITNSRRDPRVLLNPTVIFSSSEKDSFPEGCLSIPKKLFLVERPVSIKVQYQDEKGGKHILKAKGWEARVILHEVDHLEGITVNQKGKEISVKEAKKIMKDKHESTV